MQAYSKIGLVTTFLLACLASTGCSTSGNGNLVEMNLTVQGFTKVKSLMPINIAISEGPSFTMKVSTDSNLQSLLTTKTVGDTLEVAATTRINPTNTSAITITLPQFLGATLTNSGDVTVTGIAPGRDLSFLNTGDARLSFTGSVNALEAELTGVSPIILTGTANSLDAKLAGHTQIDALALSATNVVLTTTDHTSTGNIIATVNGGTAVISLGGGGDITLHGTASSIEQHDDGPGSIIIAD